MHHREPLKSKYTKESKKSFPTHLSEDIIETINQLIVPEDRLNVYNILCRDLNQKDLKKTNYLRLGHEIKN